MFRHTLAAIASALVSYSYASAQDSILEQEAHRPYYRKPGTDSNTPTGYTPQQIRHAYGIDQIAIKGPDRLSESWTSPRLTVA
jgi:hypothetical protein